MENLNSGYDALRLPINAKGVEAYSPALRASARYAGNTC